MKTSAPSTDELKALLTDRLEELAEHLLGAPTKDSRRRGEWVWAASGGAKLIVRGHGGKLRGAFYNHAAGQGGSPLDMLMFARGLNVAEAIRWAKDWLGIAEGEYTPSPAAEKVLQERQTQRAARDAEAAREAASRITYARRLWGEARPVAGTVAERYLVQTRRIVPPASGWPDAIRFHQRSCALIACATTAAGDVVGVQRVYLTAEGRKIDAEEIERRELPAGKHSSGVFDGAAVRLPGTVACTALLAAEGPETGLSAWVSTGIETCIALGGFRKIAPPAGRPIVLCRDDDKRHSPADNQLRKLVAEWRVQGIDARLATPWAVRRFDKSDLNDTLRVKGERGVSLRVDLVLNPQATAVERHPVGLVRTMLDDAIAGFFREASAWRPDSEQEDDVDAGRVHSLGSVQIVQGGQTRAGAAHQTPVHAIKVDVGVGKTRAAYRYSLRLLTEMRSRGDQRAIAVAVPTHKLGDEQAMTFNAIAAEAGTRLTARVWRGMEALDPGHADFADPRIPGEQKTKMCRNLEAVDAAREAMADAFKAACRQRSKSGIPALGVEPGGFVTCPFFGECAYQAQREAVADVWIVPHEMLFLQMPKALGKIAMLVVDESCWADGLEGVHGKPMSVLLRELEHADRIVNRDGLVQHIDTDRLAFLRHEMIAGLMAQIDGPVVRDTMMDGHLNVENVHEAVRLEYRRWVDAGLHPRMSESERVACVRAAVGNSRVLRLVRVWNAMTALLEEGGPEASGWLTLATEYDKEGDELRALHTKRRKDIRSGWLVPTLILDATLDVDLLRPYWPAVEVTAELLATAPHQHIRQVVDRSYSLSMLGPLDAEQAEADPETAQRRIRNLRQVHAVIMREARRFAPGRVLVVCQKTIKEALPGLGPIPGNVELAHHNAVAGRDEWGPHPGRAGVRALIVVGRTMPGVGAVNRLTEALTGIAVERLDGGWYERGDAVREMAGDVGMATETERHPHPIAEAIRWQICEGELIQIVGRPRGVNRSAADPVDVLIMTDAPVPLPIERMLSSSDLAPDSSDLMLAAGGISFENGRHAVAAYPTLWPSWTAARQAILRSGSEGRSATSLFKKDLLIEECRTPLTRVDYQVAGAGQKPAVAWCDLGTLADPEAFLISKLGTLAFVRVAPTEPPDPPVRPAGRQPESAPEPASGDMALAGTGQPPPRPMAGIAALSPAAALPADLDWGRHVWLADHEMPGEWWPGVMPRPVTPSPSPVLVNATAVRPHWHDDTSNHWRRDMPSDHPPPGRAPFAWVDHEPMRIKE